MSAGPFWVYVGASPYRKKTSSCSWRALLQRWPGEETPAFLLGRSLLDELEEDTPRGPAPRSIFGQHTAVRLTCERFSEDGATAVLAQGKRI